MTSRRCAAAAVLVQLLAGPQAWGQTPAPPSSSAAPASKHLVWRVVKAERTVAFLVGSVHVLSKNVYPLPPVFDTVFDESATLVEEIDLGAQGDATTLIATAAASLLGDGQTLRTVLDPPTYARVERKAASAGLPMLLLDRMKPWLAAMTLAVPELQRAGFDPAYGLDRHYYDRARAAARPVRGLETAAFQIEQLNGLPMAVQVELLRATIDDIEAQVGAVAEIVAGWQAGDVEALERLLLAEFKESPEVYQRLLVDRNRDWVPKIAACTETAAPCLVVVGGAHLLGPDGLITLLRSAGFTLEQM